MRRTACIITILIAVCTPNYAHCIGMSGCSRGLELNSFGILTCTADTISSPGSTPEVKAELQKNGVTIKTWSHKSNGLFAVVDESYAVASGYAYQLKTTHSVNSGKFYTYYSRIIYY